MHPERSARWRFFCNKHVYAFVAITACLMPCIFLFELWMTVLALGLFNGASLLLLLSTALFGFLLYKKKPWQRLNKSCAIFAVVGIVLIAAIISYGDFYVDSRNSSFGNDDTPFKTYPTVSIYYSLFSQNVMSTYQLFFGCAGLFAIILPIRASWLYYRKKPWKRFDYISAAWVGTGALIGAGIIGYLGEVTVFYTYYDEGVWPFLCVMLAIIYMFVFRIRKIEQLNHI
jgi:hypothetical protein